MGFKKSKLKKLCLGDRGPQEPHGEAKLEFANAVRAGKNDLLVVKMPMLA